MRAITSGTVDGGTVATRRRYAKPLTREGPASRALSVERVGRAYAVDAVAVSDNLAARDLRSGGKDGVELLVLDPRGDDLGRLLALLGGLEETERAEDAVAGLDEVVAREPRKLAQLRDESLVDLARSVRRRDSGQRLRSGEWSHACHAPSVPSGQESPNELPAARRPGVKVEEEDVEPSTASTLEPNAHLQCSSRRRARVELRPRGDRGLANAWLQVH